MNLTMLKSKLHRATVTDANLAYEGSISIDPALIQAAELLPHERVEVYNCNNGQRFATYVIPGKAGEICLNGAAARCALPGDLVIIASYCSLEAEAATRHVPTVVMLDAANEVVPSRKAITGRAG